MVSESAARSFLTEAKRCLLILMQENDRHEGLVLEDWSEEYYQAISCIEQAENHLDRAALI